MDTKRLDEIIRTSLATTIESATVVDVHYLKVGVDAAAAKAHKAELYDLLAVYPRLIKGINYIEFGGELGDQQMALILFAIGQVAGLWQIVTPATLGLTGPAAEELAGAGFVMNTEMVKGDMGG